MLIEIGPQIIVGSLLKKFDGSSKMMKKILKILLKPYWQSKIMETALTPMEFSRRAKNLYADREAVVDGD